ncbi:MAG: hypothetical protein ACRD1L_05430 [Terriglobales bacterium]
MDMTGEEMERTMAFLLEQQARFDGLLSALAAAQARTEQSLA